MGKKVSQTDFDVPVKLENQPLIESIAVDLPAPSLNDNTADLDRLARTLGQLGYSPVQIAPGKMDELVRRMRGNDLCFRAVAGYTGTHWEVLDVVARSPDSAVLGFALDLGTSSLVFRLIDIARKKIIREVSVENPQVAWGEDILSRIIFARESRRLSCPSGLAGKSLFGCDAQNARRFRDLCSLHLRPILRRKHGDEPFFLGP